MRWASLAGIFIGALAASLGSGGLSAEGYFTERGNGVQRESIYVFENGEHGRVVEVGGRKAVEYIGSPGGQAGVYIFYLRADGTLPPLDVLIRTNHAAANILLRKARAEIGDAEIRACLREVQARHSASTKIRQISGFYLDEGTTRMDPLMGVVYQAQFTANFWSGRSSRYELRCRFAHVDGTLRFAEAAWLLTRVSLPTTMARIEVHGTAGY